MRALTKNFSHARLADFGCVKAGVGDLSESIKKGKFVTKFFFSDNIE